MGGGGGLDVALGDWKVSVVAGEEPIGGDRERWTPPFRVDMNERACPLLRYLGSVRCAVWVWERELLYSTLVPD